MTAVINPLAYTIQEHPTEKTSITYAQLFNSWFPITNEQTKLCNELYDYFYYAVRIIDDVQDETSYRNGKPTANVVFGLPLTINAGMTATTLLMEKILEFKNDQVTKVFLNEFKLMWEGQGEQLMWNHTKKCPSIEEVVTMTQKKGVLVTLFGRILCALCGKDESAYLNLFNKFNILIQIENDIDGTAHSRDITEAQYNFVTVYAILQERKLKDTNRFEQILLSKTNDEKLLNEAKNILIETGAFELCFVYMQKILMEIMAECKQIGGNKFCEEVITYYGTKKLLQWGKDLKNSTGLLQWGKDLDNSTGLLQWGKDLDNSTGLLQWGKDLKNSTGLLQWGKDL